MRQNFSSPTLSPLPPYPTGSTLKEPLDAPPALSALTDKSDSMRATHIIPRTVPASPERPGTAYSTRSTIRQVEPSPDSLKDAFENGFADSDTPAPEREPFPSFQPRQDETMGAHIPSTEPSSMAAAPPALPGGPPSGRSSPQKPRPCSPQKSRSRSPLKQAPHTPILPTHQESPSSSYSAADSDACDPPDTPSPTTREQQRQAYAPLHVREPTAGQEVDDGESAVGHATHVRTAGYVREAKDRRVARKPLPRMEGKWPQVKPAVVRVDPPAAHIVQAMQQQKHEDSAQMTSPKNEPTRHTSISRRSEASGASVASKHSIFSTPGRDEMERKKPIVEEDEGPFAKATGMQDLEQQRLKLSEAKKEEDEGGKEKRWCGVKCVVM